MSKAEEAVTVESVIAQIEALPKEFIPQVQKYLSRLTTEDKKQSRELRGCLRPDSLMHTQPVTLIHYPLRKEDKYER